MHTQERGFNALLFSRAAHSWVRRVTFLNADLALTCFACSFNTWADIHLDVTAPRASTFQGHKGLTLAYGTDHLITNWTAAVPMHHDVSVSDYEMGSVVSDGVGADINIDFHRMSPYGMLVTNVHHGMGSRPLASGGNVAHGGRTHAAALNTFWNLQGRLQFYPPHPDTGPLLNFMGWRTAGPMSPGPYEWWFERLPRVTPVNLHASMWSTRSTRLQLQALNATGVLPAHIAAFLPPDSSVLSGSSVNYGVPLGFLSAAQKEAVARYLGRGGLLEAEQAADAAAAAVAAGQVEGTAEPPPAAAAASPSTDTQQASQADEAAALPTDQMGDTGANMVPAVLQGPLGVQLPNFLQLRLPVPPKRPPPPKLPVPKLPAWPTFNFTPNFNFTLPFG
jgi:hypothetical protein